MNLRITLFAACAMFTACQRPPAITADDVAHRYETATQAYENDLSAFERTAESGVAFSGNLTPLADYLRAAMRQRGNEAARAKAGALLSSVSAYQTPVSEAEFAEIAATVPAESPEWLSGNEAIRHVAEALPADDARRFLNVLADHNPDRSVQAMALVSLAQLERREHNLDAFAALYPRLTPYMDVDGMRFPIRLLNPENKVVVGMPAPSFSLRNLDSDAVVTSESLRGRYYLMDFWATWCPPCVVERAALTRAQEHFGGERFTVVSVSLDNTPEIANAFRQRRWPMHWTNLYLGGHYDGNDMSFQGQTAQDFDIDWIGLPQLVLVSPEGQVLALRDQLEGPMLERTLTEYLGPAH